MLGDTTVVSFLWLLVSVLMVIGLAYWVTRYVVGRAGFGSIQTGRRMEVVSQLTLGRDQKLILVQAGGRWLLLGVTNANISALTEFTEEEAAAWEVKNENKAAFQGGPVSFREALRKMLDQKERR